MILNLGHIKEFQAEVLSKFKAPGPPACDTHPPIEYIADIERRYNFMAGLVKSIKGCLVLWFGCLYAGRADFLAS